MASGVFGLDKIYKKQVKNVDEDTFTHWPEGSTSGYVTGNGAYPPFTGGSSVFKIDLSADLAIQLSNSPDANGGAVGGFSNKDYGYWAGGHRGNPAARSEISRMDLASEVISLPGTPLPAQNWRSATMETAEYGYGAGGETGLVGRSEVYRIDFNTEVTTDIATTLPERYSEGLGTQSDFYGYVVGGYLPLSTTETTSIRRFDFNSETHSVIPAVTEEVTRLCGVTENPYGAIMQRGKNTSRTSNLSRLEFSSETVRTYASQTSEAMQSSFGSSSTSHGYFSTGYSPVSPFTNKQWRLQDKIDFTSDTRTTLPDFPTTRGGVGGFTNKGIVTRRRTPKTIGYFMGGYDGTFSSYVKRMDFTSDTSSTPTMNLSHATRGMYGVANNNFGYAMGGLHAQGTPPPGTGDNYESRLHRIDFATENLTVFSATPEAHTNATTLWGVDDMYGWKAGDIFNAPPSPVGTRSDIRRLDYSTESWNVPGTIQPTRQAEGLIFSDVKNRNGISIAGWGYTPPTNYYPQSLLKYQTTNDTINATSPYVELGLHKRYTSNVSTPQYGYMSGGEEPGSPTGKSNVLRFDFSSDLLIDTSANSHPHQRGTGVSSNHHGYFCQGQSQVGSSTHLSTITKFDFSTETASPAPDMNGGGDYILGSMPNGI